MTTTIKPSPAAYSAWTLLWRAGFNLKADGEQLLVSPTEGLVESTQDFIRDNKAGLLAVCRRLDEFGEVCARLNADATRRCVKRK